MKFNDQFNKKQSIANSKEMLEDYRYYHQLAKVVTIHAIKSPVLSDMPKATHYQNVNEDRMISHLARQEFAKQYCDVIDATIASLDDDVSRFIINECYIKCRYDNGFIMDKVGVAETRYYELKNVALFDFAISCYGKPVMLKDGSLEVHPLLVDA